MRPSSHSRLAARFRLLAQVAVLLTLLAGCKNEFSLPQNAKIECSDPSECPEGWTCSTVLDRCVKVADVGQDTPALDGEAVLQPARLREGAVATLTFTAKGELAMDPEVAFKRGAVVDHFTKDEALSHDLTYVYTYTAKGRGVEPEDADCPIAIVLTGVNGSQSGPISGGVLRFDFEAPGLLRVQVSGSPARKDGVVRLSFSSSEPVRPDPVVRLVAGEWSAAMIKDAASAGDDYVFTLAVQGTEPEGAVELRVDLEDTAGNRSPDGLAGTAVFDFTEPSLRGEPTLRVSTAPEGSTVARDGSQAILTFATDEAVAGDPVVTVGGLAMDRVQQVGPFVYTRTVHDGDWGAPSPATVPIVISFTDLAGNESGPLDGPPLGLDFQAPTLVAHTLPTGPFASPVATQTLILTTSEELDASQISAHLGRFGTAECDPTPAPTTHFTCTFGEQDDLTHSATEPAHAREGTVAVTVVLRDAAGNLTSETLPETVTFDFTRPDVSVTAEPCQDAFLGLGQMLTVTVGAGEPLQGGLSVGSTPALAFDGTCGVGTSCTLRYLVPASEDGATTYTSFSVTAMDLAGNVGQATAACSVTPDGKPPVATGYAFSSSKVAKNAAFTLSFNVDDEPQPLASAVVSFTGGDVTIPMTQRAQPLPGFDYTFEGTAPDEGTVPFYTGLVTLVDRAGNRSSDSPGTVEIDAIPPTLAGLEIAPLGAKVNDTVRVVISADEPLAGPLQGAAPLRAVNALDPLHPIVLNPTDVQPGRIGYTYTCLVTEETVQGTYTLQDFTLVDLADNQGAVDLAASGLPRSFDVDSSIPQLTNLTASSAALGSTPPRFSAQPGYEQMALEFDCSEPLLRSALAVHLGDQPMQWAEGPTGAAPGPYHYRFLYDVSLAPTAGLSDGLATVSVEARDPAGNTGYGTLSVELDFTAPRLLASDANPAVARNGATVAYSIAPSEPLAEVPTLSVVRQGGAETLDFTFSSGLYSFTHAVADADANGTYAVEVSLADVVGNRATVPAARTFEVDSTIPVLSGLAVSPSRASRVAGHDVLTIELDSSELAPAPLGQFPARTNLVVSVGGRYLDASTACDPPTGAGPYHYTCRYAVTSADVAGPNQVRVGLSDGAGNTGTVEQAVAFDFAAPSVVSTSVSPAVAPLGGTLVYTVNADEPLDAATPPQLAVAGLATGWSSMGVSSSVASWTRAVQVGDPSGSFAVQVSALCDLVGNCRASAAGTPVVLDTAPPKLVGAPVIAVTYGGASQTRAKSGATVTVTFSVSKPLAEDPVVSLGGLPMARQAASSPPQYVYARTVAAGVDSEGGLGLVADMTDTALNHATVDLGSIVADFSAPSVISTLVTPPLAPLGATITYTLNTSEPLNAANPPTLAVAGVAGWEGPIIAGNSALWKHLVQSSDPSGASASTLGNVCDGLDNCLPSAAGASVVIDPEPPALAGAPTLVVTYGGAPRAMARHGSVVDVSFTATEPQFSDPTVTLGGLPMAKVSSSGLQYLYRRTVAQGADAAGSAGLVVELLDVALNHASASLGSVLVDFEAPVATARARPSPAPLGAVVTYTASADEVLDTGATPTFTVAGLAGWTGPTFAGTEVSWTRAIGSADGAGSHAVVLGNLCDLAGNCSPDAAAVAVAIDNVLPALVGTPAIAITFGGQPHAQARDGSAVDVTFAVSKALASDPEVILGGKPMAKQSQAGLQYTYRRILVAGVDAAGSAALVAALVDGAQNHATGSLGSVVVDYAAPVVTTTAAPSPAPLGSLVSFQASADEVLDAASAPIFAVAGLADWAGPVFSGTSVRWTRAVVSADATGDHGSLVGNLCDRAGNCTTSTPAATVVLDNVPPGLGQPATVSISYLGAPHPEARDGSVVTAAFTVTEPLSGDPAVTVGGKAMTKVAQSGQQYTFERTVLGAQDAAGSAGLVAALVDVAGNSASASLGSAVLDFAAPVLTTSLTPSPAPLGATMTYTAAANEVLDGAPVPAFSVVGLGGWSAPLFTGTSVSWTRAVGAADGSGSHAVTVGNLCDRAGNCTASAPGSAVLVDNVPPSVSGAPAIAITLGGAPRSQARDGSVVSVTFTVTEALSADPVVKLGDQVMAKLSQSGLQYTYRRALASGSDAAGNSGIIASLVDVAQNSGSQGLGAVVVDYTAPTVSTSASPAPAPLGATVTFSASADEVLDSSATPSFSVAGLAGWSAPAFSGTSVTWTRAVGPNPPDAAGAHASTLGHLCDLAGNCTASAPGASVVVDNVLPVLVGSPTVSITLGGVARTQARDGSVVTAVFTVQEPLAGDPVVTLGGQPMAKVGQAGQQYTYQRTVAQGSDAGGNAGVVAEIVDAAQNHASASLGSVVVDFAAPVVATSALPSPAPRNGTLTYRATADEVLDAGATPSLSVTGVAPWSAPVFSGTSVSWTHSVGATDGSGSYASTIGGLCDLAGNCTPSAAGAPVIIDNVVPSLAGPPTLVVTYAAALRSQARHGSVVDVTFTVSEALSSAPAVSLGGKPMALQSQSGLQYTYRRTIDQASDAAGSAPLIAVLVDPATNTASASLGSVVVDYAAPVVSTAATPSPAPLAATVAYAASANEVLDAAAAPSFSVAGLAGWSGPVFSGTSVTWTRTVGSGDASGSHAATLGNLCDLAGNCTPSAAGAAVVVDNVLPAVSGTPTVAISYGGAPHQQARNGSIVDVTFTVTEALAADPAVTLGGKTMAKRSQAGLTYTYRRTLDLLVDVAGNSGLLASLADAAGNHGSASLGAVVVDFTLPAVTPGVAPTLAGLGATITYSAAADEVLDTATPPSLTVAGLTGWTGPTVTGTSAAWTRRVGAGDASGSYASTLGGFCDLAGNCTGSAAGPAVLVDSVPPDKSGAPSLVITYGGQPHPQARAGSVVDVTFTVTEALQGDPAVTLGGLPMAKQSQSGLQYTYRRTLAAGLDAAGNAGLVASLVDGALNNASVSLGSVVVDYAAPVVTPGVTPALASLGSTVTYSATANELLDAAAPPTLVVAGLAGWTGPAVTGTSATWTRLIGSGDASGSFPSTHSGFCDLAGNCTGSAAGPSVVVDNVPPDLSGAPTLAVTYLGTPRAKARDGSVVSVTFSVTEALLADPVVTLGGQPMGKTAQGGLSYTFRRTVVKGVDAAGAAALVASLVDPANNAASVSLGAALVDYDAPVVTPGVSPALAGLGATLTYTAASDELLDASATPTLTVANAVLATGWSAPSFAGTSVTWTRAVQSLDPAGSFASSVGNLCDLAGNCRASAAGPNVVVENDPPALSGPPTITITYSALSRTNARNGSVVSVTFTVDETLQADPLVTLGGQAMTKLAQSGLQYTYRRTVLQAADAAGSAGITAALMDLALNGASVNLGAVFIDYAAPTFSSTSSPSPAPLGAVMTYVAAANEALDTGATPTFTVSGLAGWSAASYAATRTSVSWTRTVLAGDAAGAHMATVGNLCDLAANCSSSTAGALVSIDNVLPDASPTSITISTGYPNARSGAGVTARFQASETLAATPTASLGAQAMTCVVDASSPPRGYQCTRTISGVDAEGTTSVVAMLRDPAGNQQAVDVGPVTIDRTSPDVASGSKSLTATAAGTNPLRFFGETVRAIPPGDNHVASDTQLLVRFSSTELLHSDPAVVGYLQGVGSTVSFTKLPESAGTYYAYAYTVASPTDGVYDLRVVSLDRAGNSATSWPFQPAFTVDRVAPPAADTDTPDRIVYRREPWGRTGPAPSAPAVSRFSMRGGASALGAEAYGVVAYDGSDAATASVLGSALRNPDGSFDEKDLVRSDHSFIYLAAVDAAGNQGAPLPVRDIEWVATMGRKVENNPFGNPNRFSATSLFSPTLVDQTPYYESGSPSFYLSSQDLLSTVMTSRPRWQAWAPGATTPQPLYGAAMAYDGARGRTVLFGGWNSQNSGSASDQTWEFDGSRWELVCGTGTSCSSPPARWGHSMVYDAKRGVVVLASGGQGNPLHSNQAFSDTWEWDGSRWRDGTVGVQPAAWGAGMVYDPVRARTVFFGGTTGAGTYLPLGDTWEYDGKSWVKMATTGPAARAGHAMAWDGVDESVLLFGGCTAVTSNKRQGECDALATQNDTWRWNGTAWTLLNPVTRPSSRSFHAMAWSSGRSRIVMFGGRADGGLPIMSLNETYLWTGSNWSPVTMVSTRSPPQARLSLAAAYDSARGGFTLYGGDTSDHEMSLDDAASDTWRFEDFASVWTPCRSDNDPKPPGRRLAAMEYDRYRRYGVLQGGWYSGGGQSDTWLWEGSGWRQYGVSGPARYGHGMAWHAGRLRVVSSGGDTTTNTWEWTGTAWSNTSAAGPTPRRYAATAYDSSRGVVVVWGGVATTGTALNSNVWEYGAGGGTGWVQRTLVGPPSLRVGASLVYDTVNNRLVLNGGANPPVRYAETWYFTWDAANTRWVATKDPNGGDGYYGAGMVFEPTRQRPVRFGGQIDLDDPVDPSDTQSSINRTSEWDEGTYWNTFNFSNYNDGSLPEPRARYGHAMTYDSDRKRIVVFGGDIGFDGFSNWADDTWVYDPGGNATQAQLLDVDFASAGPADNATYPEYALKKLGFVWWGGGAGFSGLSRVNGARLYLWDQGEWQLLGGTGASSPPALIPTTPITSPALIDRALTGPTQTLHLATRPTFTNGGGPVPDGDPEFDTSVRTDYSEVQFDYRLCAPEVLKWTNGSSNVVPTTATYTASGDTCSLCNRHAGSCGGSTGPEGVHSFTVPTWNPPAGTTWYFNATASGFDTVLYLRKSIDGADVPSACNDDSTPPGGRGSRIPATSGSIALEKGMRYYVVVDSFGTACGSYALSATFSATP